jgi:GNAT superfamily N-acetyltransferase
VSGTRLLDLLLDAAGGQFPPVDGGVTVVPALEGDLEAIVAFTGHAVVATALRQSDLIRAGADGYGGAMAPDVQRFVAGPDGWIGVHDVTLVGVGLGDDGSRPLLPLRQDLDGHPRVAHALDLRREVRVHGDDRGVVTVGRGLAGRTEISLELESGRQGRGAGGALLSDALRLVPERAPVFAAVSPGNARSLRMFLRHGFLPIASEIQIRPRREGVSS